MSATFVVINRGDAILTYSLVSSDPRVVLSPASGTVAPGATASVQVTATVPAEISARTTLTTQIMATTNVSGSSVRAIPVTFRSRGAQLVFDRTVIGFGQRPIGFASSQAFTVSNVGDAAATVTIAAPGGELSRRFGDAGAVTVLPGASVTGDIGYLPVDLGADTALAGVTVTGARCGAVFDHLTLGGEGVAGTGVMVQGGPIDFGDVSCGFAPVARRVRLVNPSMLDARFTASLLATIAGDERLYHVTPAEGTVPAGGAIELVTSAEAIRAPASPRMYATTLRITTTLGVDAVHDVVVRETLRSPDLRVSRSFVDFGVFPDGSPSQLLQLTVRNVGNADATLGVTPVSAPFSLSGPSMLSSNASGSIIVLYDPTSSPSMQQVRVDALGACTVSPEIVLRGGTGPFAVVETAPPAIATCPPPATMSTEMHIRNEGDQILQIQCREYGTSGLALHFSQILPDGVLVFGDDISVAPGGLARVKVTMSPGPIQAGSVTAVVDCFGNEPITNLRTTAITRTLVEDGEPCVAPSAP